LWAAGGVALPAGPLLGGLLVAALGWRSVFLVNVPIVLVAGLATALVTASGAPAGRGRGRAAGLGRHRARRAVSGVRDVRGGRGGARRVDGHDRGRGGRGGGGSGRLPARRGHRRRPMLPLWLFRGTAFRTANAVAGVINFGTLGMLFPLTLYVQTVQQRSAAAGVALLPLFLPLCLLAPLAGRVTSRRGPRPGMVAGLGVAAVGVGLLATWQVATPYAALAPAMLAWGGGLGVLTPTFVAAAVGAVPTEHAGLASGGEQHCAAACGAISVAVCGAVAGSPADPDRFLASLHLAALATAGLFLVCAWPPQSSSRPAVRRPTGPRRA
jgi:MFS transporter, DHA2 family, methylenomycin A resistance protein